MAAAQRSAFVWVGTLDNPTALTPDIHIYARTKTALGAIGRGRQGVRRYYDPRQEWPAASRAVRCWQGPG